MKRGKKYQNALKMLPNDKSSYTVVEACEMIKKIAFAKFDESLELHIKLNLKKSQSVRDTLVFPNNFSEEKKILVFARDDKAQEARDNGALYVGDMDLIEKIKAGWQDFDICVATPDMMKEVGKLGPILGRRGLMPNPKTHTVTTDIKGALAELKMGRTEFRSDKAGVVHLVVGKLSMGVEKLTENVNAAVAEISRKKPQDAKGNFIMTASLCSTMGPGLFITESTANLA